MLICPSKFFCRSPVRPGGRTSNRGGYGTMGPLSFLDRSHSIAKPGFSRWLVPPAALSIHLAIGQAYAFSVFKKPLNYLVQVSVAGGGLKALPGVDSPHALDW